MSAQKLKGGVSLRGRFANYRMHYMLMLPGLLFFLIFRYVPIYGIIIAFKDVSPFGGVSEMMSAPFVGLKHFINFFNSYYFWNIIGNTLAISGLKLLFGFPAPIILALLLNEIRSVKFKKITQTISYLPHFLSWVVVAGLFVVVLSTSGGIVNEIVKAFGGKPIYFLGDPKYFRGVIVISHIWKMMGWGSIIYLAALSGINPELYEAAIVDGAGRWKQMLHITLPGRSYVIVLMFIFAIGNLLRAGFEQILLLYSPSVYSVADIIDTYVYREGLIGLKYSYTTAIGLFKSVMAMILILSANFIAKRLGKEGIW
jgi:putative aldouronate transport system permease protein